MPEAAAAKKKLDLGSIRDVLLGRKRKPPAHELKWKLPEARLTAPVQDAEDMVGKLKKIARFVAGGEFADEVHAKEYGEGIYAYFIVRTDRKTQQEKLIADAYMIREDEKLGFDVESAYGIAENLDEMGYQMLFTREITMWSFFSGALRASVYSVTGFGDFLEISLPATKLDSVRKKNQEQAEKLFERLGVKREEVVPTDVITLQLVLMQQAAQQEGGEGGQGGAGDAGGAGGFSLG